MIASSLRTISCFGSAPTSRSISLPSLNTSNVGMLRTLKRDPVIGFSSVLSLATFTRPANSPASCSITGAIILQGPHHGAHISSSTGSGERSTSSAKFASVTIVGCVDTASGVLHCPQTGSSPARSFSAGTRLFAPHFGHLMTSASFVALI